MPLFTKRKHSWGRMKINLEVKERMIGSIKIIKCSDTNIKLSEK